jgi:SNW domain-containing protein 1
MPKNQYLITSPILPSEPPNYGERRSFKPLLGKDFGDGGAFPELHLRQYPRRMGNPDKHSNQLSQHVDIRGNMDYNSLLKSNQHEQTSLRLKSINDHCKKKEHVDHEAWETMSSLQKRLDKLYNGKVSKTLPSKSPAPFYIKYTPESHNFLWNSRSHGRLLHVQEMIPDPMEPPQHKILKVPRKSSTNQVPVMHSPPNAVDREEAKNWKIPPAISNWKNAKGFIIPLDKRLAADGRGFQGTKINDNFAKLSEALYIAEKKAREETKVRNYVAKENLMQQKERENAEMRALALQAKLSKFCIKMPKKFNHQPKNYDNNDFCYKVESQITLDEISSKNTIVERKQIRNRNDIRSENRDSRERERRLLDAGEHGYKRSKITRDHDRDISERLAIDVSVQR